MRHYKCIVMHCTYVHSVLKWIIDMAFIESVTKKGMLNVIVSQV